MPEKTKTIIIIENWWLILQNYWVLVSQKAPRIIRLALMYITYFLLWGIFLTLFFKIQPLWLVPLYGIATYFVIEEITDKACRIAGRDK